MENSQIVIFYIKKENYNKTGKDQCVNIWNILKLKVSDASNDLSIIEAYIAIISNGHTFPFGIFDGNIPVGFFMICYDVDDSFDNPPQIAYGNYSIWRLMIDKKLQNKGYGKEAMKLAIDFIRTF